MPVKQKHWKRDKILSYPQVDVLKSQAYSLTEETTESLGN